MTDSPLIEVQATVQPTIELKLAGNRVVVTSLRAAATKVVLRTAGGSGAQGLRGETGQRGPVARSMTLETPRHDEDIVMLVAPEDLALRRLVAALGGTGSVTFSLWHGSDPEHRVALVEGVTVTRASPVRMTLSPTPSIAADEFIWLTTSAQTPTAEQLFVNLDLEYP